MTPRLSAVLVLGLSAAVSASPPRPAVDLSAMREAMGLTTDEEGVPFPSAASYAHFLRARLAHHENDNRVALDELRLALASDDSNPYLMTELAEEMARGAQLDRAETQLKRVIERFPEYQPAQLLMGRVLYEGQKSAKAKPHLLKAIRLRPNQPDAYLVLTQLWLDQNRVDEAVRVVDELGSAVPGEPVGYRRLGLALAERNDPRAERLLQRAVERDPADVEAWGAQARIAETAGHTERALELWEEALEHEPDNRDALLNAGRVALRLRRVTEAKAYFDELLSQGREPELAVKIAFSYLASRQLPYAAEVLDDARRQGTEPRLHFYAGLVHERARNFKQAAEAFLSVPDGLGQVSLEARLHRGQCLSQLGKHAEAVALLQELASLHPELGGVEPALSRTLERAGRLKEAEGLLLRSAARTPSPELLDALSGFYARHNRLDDAVNVLSGALERRPRDEAITLSLASALERKGEWKRAVERTKSLLDANPRNGPALNFIGYTLAQNGADLDEAERHVRRALETKPDSPAYLDSLGWVLVKRGRFEEAGAILERAVESGPDDATLYEHLGEAMLKLGKKARAAECFSHALELVEQSPDDAERPTQRTELERKLKALSAEGKGR